MVTNEELISTIEHKTL